MNLSDILGSGAKDTYSESSVTLTGNTTLIGYSDNHIYKLNPSSTNNYEVTLPDISDGLVVILSNVSASADINIIVKDADKEYNLLSGSSDIILYKTASGYISTALEDNTFWSSYSEQKIMASDAQAGDRFGEACVMSGDGNTCVISACDQSVNSTNNDAIYVYIRSGSTWSQQQKIISSDWQLDDNFGENQIDISFDGNTIIVGARYEDTGASNVGSTYIFVRSGSTWSQQAKLQASDKQLSDSFGISCSISNDGNTCVVGAYLEDTGGSNAGAAYVFTRSGSTWTQQQKIQSSDIQANDYFGLYSSSMSGDGNTLFVGAFGEDAGGNMAGAGYIFVRSGSTWSQQAKLMASDAQAEDSFSMSSTISEDGNILVVGAYLEDTGGSNTGAIYIFKRVGISWSQHQKIQVSNLQVNDRFGNSCSISNDGSTLIIGSFGENDNAGAAYVFVRSGSTWTQRQKLVSSDVDTGDRFGCGCSVSDDGNTCVVSANYENTGGTSAGAAYIFEVNN